jgi:hypothetical protein
MILYNKPAMRPLQFFNDINRSTLSVASFAHRNKCCKAIGRMLYLVVSRHFLLDLDG